MRAAIFIMSLMLAGNTLAHVCPDYAAPSGAKIEMSTIDGVEFLFRAPATLEGEALVSMSVALYEKDGDGSFSALLQFESSGKYAKGSYMLAWKKLEGAVYARYGDKQCGPRLSLQINT